jgi:hypothetical protein
MLDSRGADEKVLANVPLYIQRALVRLQRKDLFPSINIRFLTKDQIETELRTDGSIAYQFITLPKDFREIDKFDVEDTRYYWFANEYEIQRESARRNQPLFTIKEVRDKITGNRRSRLVLQPFPQGDKEISIDYYIDGSEESLDYITQDYWEVILTNIETDLGLRSEESSNSEMADVVNQHKHREGFGRFNNTIKTTRPTFFASKRRR